MTQPERPGGREPSAGDGVLIGVLLGAGALVCLLLTVNWYGDWQQVRTLTLWFGSSGRLARDGTWYGLLTVAGAVGTFLLARASWRTFHKDAAR